MKNDLKTASYKIRVTPEESEHVQKICFENGVEWKGRGKVVLNTKEEILCIYNSYIYWSMVGAEERGTEISYQDFVKKYEKKPDKILTGYSEDFKRTTTVSGLNKDKKPELDGFRKVLVVSDVDGEVYKDPCRLISNLNNRFQVITEEALELFLKGEDVEISQFKRIKEIEEPKKIPYDEETFPFWAVWTRKLDYLKGCRDSISTVSSEGIFIQEEDEQDIFYFKDIDKYEIAGTDGIWKPFYQTK